MDNLQEKEENTENTENTGIIEKTEESATENAAAVKEETTEPQEAEKPILPAKFKAINYALLLGVLASAAILVLFLSGIVYIYDKKVSILSFYNCIVSITKINGSSWPKYVSMFCIGCVYPVFVAFMIRKTIAALSSYLKLKNAKVNTIKEYSDLCAQYKKTIRSCLFVYCNTVLFVLLTETLKKYELPALCILVLAVGGAVSLVLAFAYNFTTKPFDLKKLGNFALQTVPVFAACALLVYYAMKLEYGYKTINAIIVLIEGYGVFDGFTTILNTLWVCLIKSGLYVSFIMYLFKLLGSISDMAIEDCKGYFTKLVVVSAIIFGGYLAFEVLIFAGENASLSMSDIINPETRNVYIPIVLFSVAGLIFASGKEKVYIK